MHQKHALRSTVLTVIAVTTAMVLSACAPAYDEATKDALRQHVVAVSEASAAGDWPTAIGGLDALAADAAAAHEAGKLDDERLERITLAMELVRQDLEAAIATAEDAAERQRLQDEQARLQEQINQLQDPGDGGGEDDKGGKDKGGGKGED
jgi:hypothetical protein